MKKIDLKAYAKVNLTLDVLRKRNDGYHDIESIMQAVDLYDTLRVQVDDGEEEVSVSMSGDIPKGLTVGEGNLAYDAAWLILKEFQPKGFRHIKIELEKRIPVAAGLGGGSADAAAVILALNELWDCKAGLKSLIDMGARLGADIPFQLVSQARLNSRLGLAGDPLAAVCALASGIGEKLEALPSIAPCWFVIVKPDVALRTAEIYGKLDLNKKYDRPNTKAVINMLSEDTTRLNEISTNMVNMLENVTLKEYPVVADIKERLLVSGGASAVMMSGSGPSLFGIYAEEPGLEVMKEMHGFQELFAVKAL